jgi:hypothetical protein
VRWFVVFLLLANISLYLWVQHQSRLSSGSQGLPAPDIGHLRLMREEMMAANGRVSADEVPAEPAATIEEESPAVESTVSDAPTAIPGIAMDRAETTPRPDPPDSDEPTAPQKAGSADEVEIDAAAADRATAAADDTAQPPIQSPVEPEPVAEPAAVPVTAAASLQAPEKVLEQAQEQVQEQVQAPARVEDVPSPGSVQSVGDEAPQSDVLAVCEKIGPLTNDQAQQVLNGLPPAGEIDNDVTEVYLATNGYYVLIPRLASRALGRQKLAELEKAGVTDTWLFPSGPNENAISLGYFSRISSARRHADNVAAKGFETEVSPRTSSETGRWLTIRWNGPSSSREAFEAPVDVDRTLVPCGTR